MLKTLITLLKKYRQPFFLSDHWFPETIYNTLSNIISFVAQVERFFFWGWKLKDNYDFDYEGVLEVLELKFERMIVVFENGVSTDSPRILKEMKLMKKLCGRVKEDDYKVKTPFERKNGIITIDFTNDGFEYLCKGVKLSDEDCREYRSQLTYVYKAKEMLVARDIRIITKLMNTRLRYWWD